MSDRGLKVDWFELPGFCADARVNQQVVDERLHTRCTHDHPPQLHLSFFGKEMAVNVAQPISE